MLETETVLDRRRLRRSLSLWRGLGVAGLALAIGAFVLGGDKLATLSGKKQIARIAIEGTIMESREQLKMLKEIADADHVAGVLLYVNSPGGTTTGGEAIYESLREIGKKKPVVAQFGTVAASAGYIVGLASDHIVARGNTITGSVGVIVQWPEFAQLMEKIGVLLPRQAISFGFETLRALTLHACRAAPAALAHPRDHAAKDHAEHERAKNVGIEGKLECKRRAFRFERIEDQLNRMAIGDGQRHEHYAERESNKQRYQTPEHRGALL